MEAIQARLLDLEWWFTVVIVGLVVSVVASYARDGLSRGLSAVSQTYGRHADARRARQAELLRDFRASPALLVIEYMRTFFGLGISLALISGSFLLPAWNTLRKAFPEVDLAVSVLGLAPSTNEVFGVGAAILALFGGMYFWARFQGKLRFCERARKELRDSLRRHRT